MFTFTPACKSLYLKSGGTHEVFLLQTELLALKEVIIGVQDLGDILSQVTVQHGLDVVSVVDWDR